VDTLILILFLLLNLTLQLHTAWLAWWMASYEPRPFSKNCYTATTAVRTLRSLQWTAPVIKAQTDLEQ